MNDKRAPKNSGEGEASEGSFEQAATRLARIVEELERGDLPLERSLELFEEGIRLARAAEQRIASAEKRVEELLAIDPSGKPVVRPLSLSGDDDGSP